MSAQINDYLLIWVSKETELVKYLTKQEEDFRISFLQWQQPARLVRRCLWQVISAGIHHLTSSVYLWLSPLLLCLSFAFNINPLPSKVISIQFWEHSSSSRGFFLKLRSTVFHLQYKHTCTRGCIKKAGPFCQRCKTLLNVSSKTQTDSTSRKAVECRGDFLWSLQRCSLAIFPLKNPTRRVSPPQKCQNGVKWNSMHRGRQHEEAGTELVWRHLIFPPNMLLEFLTTGGGQGAVLIRRPLSA